MPATAQLLYFHLGMYADDDGYAEALPLMRMINANEQDLKVLESNLFIKIFDNLVALIIDWKEHNKIQPDRYNKGIYIDLYPVAMLTKCKQNVNKMFTQVRLGKVRLGKVRKDNIYSDAKASPELNKLIQLFEPINPSYKRLYSNTTQRSALQRMIDTHTVEKMESLLKRLPEVISRPYAPRITTPIQLEAKMGELVVFIEQERNKNVTRIAKM